MHFPSLETRLRLLRTKRTTRVGGLERWLKDHRLTVELGAKLVTLLLGVAKLLGLLAAH